MIYDKWHWLTYDDDRGWRLWAVQPHYGSMMGEWQGSLGVNKINCDLSLMPVPSREGLMN